MAKNKLIWNEITRLFNVLLMTVPFGIVWYLFYADAILLPFFRRGNWVVILLYGILYYIFGNIYDAFTASINRSSMMIFSQCLAALVAHAFMYLIIWLLRKHLANPCPLFAAFIGQIGVSVIWSILVRKCYFIAFPTEKSVIVYDMRRELADQIAASELRLKYNIIYNMTVEECLRDMSILEAADSVFLSGVHSHERNIILKWCINHNIEVYVIPRVGDVIMSGAKKMHLLHLPMLQVNRYEPSIRYLFVKRMSDIIISGIAFILLLPVFLLTAGAIKLTDGGSVFYTQKRLTKDGTEFNVIKFRSMKVDAEKDGIARLSSGDADNRITPVGKIIRKARIDELPQLLNILKGDMSIVGPRPERPEIASMYEEKMPEFCLRLQCKAGLTGYAQVYGKYNTTPYDKLLLDLMYITNPSVLEDLRIMFLTIKILFLPESTEGVAVGQTTAMKYESDLKRTE